MSSWLARAWGDRVLPLAVEQCCGHRNIDRQRRKVVTAARGRVLEVGIGTGLNLPHYDPSQVREVVGVDPSSALLAIAERRARALALPVRLVHGGAEDLDGPQRDPAEPPLLASGLFDTVVVTYTLCTIADVAGALGGMARALAPGGRLVLAEHGEAPDAAPRRWQQRLDPVWCRVAGGCHLDRPIPALLERAGFDVGPLEAAYLPGPRWLSYQYWGVLSRTERA